MRRVQAHIYERVVRGDEDIDLLFQKYKDILDVEIIVGMYELLKLSRFLEMSSQCKITFSNTDILHEFYILIQTVENLEFQCKDYI